MKKTIYFILFFCSLFFTSCEEVIDLDLDHYEKRVVINANIFVGENEYNKIRMYYSAPFYATEYEYITAAEISIKDLNSNETFPFVYSENGFYVNNSFVPNTDSEYELNISYNNNTYKALTKVTKAPAIENVEQINNSGFSGKDYEIRFYYQDDPEEENFYLNQETDEKEKNFYVGNDQFTNGNLMYDVYFAEEDQLGETIHFAIAKIDKPFYNYLNKMFSNAASAGNPFATPNGTLKGNIQNLTNNNEFPLGYFNIAKREKVSYTIQ